MPAMLGGVSATFAGLGVFIRLAPLGDLASVNEALGEAGRGIGGFGGSQARTFMEKLQHTKTSMSSISVKRRGSG